MPGIVIDSCDDRPYGPGQSDYEYDKWRDEMDDDARKTVMEEFEKYWRSQFSQSGIEPIGRNTALSAWLAATERAAQRCVEICEELVKVPYGDDTYTAMYRRAGNAQCASAIKQDEILAAQIRELADKCDDTILNSSHEDDAAIIAKYIEAGITLVLEPLRNKIGHDEETAKLAENGWERGFAAGIRSADTYIAELLCELREGEMKYIQNGSAMVPCEEKP